MRDPYGERSAAGPRGYSRVNTAVRKTLRVTAIVLGSLIVIVLVALALFDWNTLKHPIERIASAKTGRTISIGGKLQGHILSWTPTVIVHGLTLGNPPWESASPMANVDR